MSPLFFATLRGRLLRVVFLKEFTSRFANGGQSYPARQQETARPNFGSESAESSVSESGLQVDAFERVVVKEVAVPAFDFGETERVSHVEVDGHDRHFLREDLLAALK